MKLLLLFAATSVSVGVTMTIINPYAHGRAYHTHDTACDVSDTGVP